MKYQMINEELQIASCSLADLTMEQVQHFLKQWHPGDSIGTLTLFYEPDTGLLVINKDNKNYELYKSIAESFLSTDEAGRERIAKESPEGLEETMQVLGNCIKQRIVDKEVDRALKNYVPGDVHHAILRGIYKRFDNPVVIATTAFRYGVMAGKRIERAKRKH